MSHGIHDRAERAAAGSVPDAGIVERRTTIPILGNVLIESAGDGVHRRRDRSGGRRSPAVHGRGEAARARSPPERASSTRSCARCPEGDVRIRSLDNNWIEVVGRQVALPARRSRPAGVSGHAGAAGQRDEQAVAVSAARCSREMIEHTLFAVSADETRVNLSGIYVERAERASCAWWRPTGIGWR